MVVNFALAVRFALHLHEHVKDPRQRVGGNADAIVPNAHHDAATAMLTRILFAWCLVAATVLFHAAALGIMLNPVLPKEWRLFGPVEGLTGILMCGLSTAFLFATLSRMYSARTKPK